MTPVVSRTTPSPVPLHERTVPRDTASNVWVRCPDHSQLVELFGIALEPLPTALFAPAANESSEPSTVLGQPEVEVGTGAPKHRRRPRPRPVRRAA